MIRKLNWLNMIIGVGCSFQLLSIPKPRARKLEDLAGNQRPLVLLVSPGTQQGWSGEEASWFCWLSSQVKFLGLKPPFFPQRNCRHTRLIYLFLKLEDNFIRVKRKHQGVQAVNVSSCQEEGGVEEESL